jgi:hypothetical protein
MSSKIEQKKHKVFVRYEVSVRQGLRKELGLRKNNKVNMREASKPKVFKHYNI